MQGKLPMKAFYTVKSHLTRPQTLTAVKVSKQQPPQPCAFDTQLRARTVPGLIGKAGLDGKPPPFWEATMAWTRATPVLKRKLQQLPFSEFAQMSRAKRLKFSQKSADGTRFTQPGSQNAILERNTQISSSENFSSYLLANSLRYIYIYIYLEWRTGNPTM